MKQSVNDMPSIFALLPSISRRLILMGWQ